MEEISKLCDECIIELFVTYNSLNYIRQLFKKNGVVFPEQENDIYDVNSINNEFHKRFGNDVEKVELVEMLVNFTIHNFVKLSGKESYEKALSMIFKFEEF